MSRGLGVVQWFVLGQLGGLPEDKWLTVLNLVELRAARSVPTRAEEEAVRRAVRTLADRGLVEVQDGMDEDGRIPLCARLAR